MLVKLLGIHPTEMLGGTVAESAMYKILNLFFGTPKCVIISVALFVLLGFLNKVTPQATSHAVGWRSSLYPSGPLVRPFIAYFLSQTDTEQQNYYSWQHSLL